MLSVAVLGAACSTPSSSSSQPVPTWSAAYKATPATTTTMTWPTVPGWNVVSMGPRGATALIKTVTSSGGRFMTVAEFPVDTTAFHLHVGTSDPPGALSLAQVDDASSISAMEISMLVAAFNGGFKRNAGAGGVEIDGAVVSPLSAGLAAVVIDADGSLHVGLWGSQLPLFGEQVVAVRENLGLLVDGGRPTAASASSADAVWGAAVAGGPAIARSALGVDASGNVFFVGSMAALPSDLAETLVSVGAQRGMQLDINPFWVTLGTADHPGGALVGRVPGETHTPSIFTDGWQRDFVVVLAKPSTACRLVFPAPAGVATANPPLVICGAQVEKLPVPGLVR